MSGIYQSLVTVDLWTFIAQICNLLIQMYLIKRFLLDKVMAVLEQRKAAASAEIDQAKQAKAEADAIRAEYETNMAKAKQEANEIVASAQKTATSRSEELVREAQRQAAEIKQKAEADIAQERKKAVNEIKDEIGGIAMQIATKVVEREINEKDHEALIEEFIQNVGDAS